MEITPELILEHVDRLYGELSKLRRALEAIQSGVPFDEAFDEELYEEKAGFEDCESQLKRMMHHLLKFRFSTINDTHGSWMDSITDSRIHIIDDVKWSFREKKWKGSVPTKIIPKMEEIYDDSRARYESDAENWDDLEYGLNHLPDACPWSLKELITSKFSDLLKKIPSIDDPRDRLADLCEKIDILGKKYSR